MGDRDVALIILAAVGVTAFFVFAVWFWRNRRNTAHRRVSRRSRYEETRIDLSQPRGERERSSRSGRRRRSTPNPSIDLFAKSHAAEAAAAPEPDADKRED